jgi:hypothetical protein
MRRRRRKCPRRSAAGLRGRCPLALVLALPLWAGSGVGAEDLEKALRDFSKDPTLGGRLHFTYRATYEAKFYRFRGYHYPFPQDAGPLDEQAADELEDRHRGNSDQDLDQFLSIRTHNLVTPGIEKGFYQGLDTELSARYFIDLDGTPRGNESLSTYDAFPGQEDFQLRTLNAKLKLLDEHLELSGGRMFIDAAEFVHIDGGRFLLRGLRGPLDRPVEIEGFAGQRVSYYSSISERDLFTDDVYGGTLRYYPTRDTRLEVSDVFFIDNSLLLRVEQQVLPSLDLLGRFRMINEDPESLTFDVHFEQPRWGLDLRAGVLSKFGENADDFNFDYTFSRRLDADESRHDAHFHIDDLEPYDEVTLEARQEINSNHGIFAGGTGHWVRNRADQNVYNTDWYEVWGGVDTLHFPWDGLTGRLSVRYVDTDRIRRREYDPDDPLFIADVTGDGEPSFIGAELLLEQDIARRVAIGSSVEWRNYTYSSRFARLSEMNAVSVTGFGRFRQNRIITYYLGYTYERDYRFVNPDFEEVHGVKGQVQFSW